MEQRKLFKVGHGKYEFYVVAEDAKQAIDIIATRENLSFLPLKVIEEIRKIDGYNVLLVTDEELAEAEKSSNDEELQLDPEQLEKMKKDDLLRLAADMEVEVTEDMTKKEIAELIAKEKVEVEEKDIVNPEE